MIPVVVTDESVAPVIFDQPPVPVDDFCHWKVRPPAVEKPVQVRVRTVELLPDVGLTDDVPAVGVPEQADAPVPVTAMLALPRIPPPVIVTLPL